MSFIEIFPGSSTIEYVKDYRGVSSDDQRTWELSKSFLWKRYIPAVLFTIGLLCLASLVIFRS